MYITTYQSIEITTLVIVFFILFGCIRSIIYGHIPNIPNIINQTAILAVWLILTQLIGGFVIHQNYKI